MGAVQRPVRRLLHLPALPQRLTRGAVPAPPSTRADDLQERLAVLVRRSASLMRALRAVRVLDPPDWLIGAGAIRDRVWDSLHGAVPPAASLDVDLAFYDASCLGGERERSVQSAVSSHAPDICWDVTNHAAVHLSYPAVFGVEVEPLACCSDGVAMWPETAMAVGIRLFSDETLRVVAPYGLEDLFGLVCRSAPGCPRPVRHEPLAERWPRVRILDTAAPSDRLRPAGR
jgi:hypothetical protein